jgi:hypothetical protein
MLYCCNGNRALLKHFLKWNLVILEILRIEFENRLQVFFFLYLRNFEGFKHTFHHYLRDQLLQVGDLMSL